MTTPLDQDERFLRHREVTAMTGLSRPTIYRQVDQGTFPKPLRLGGAVVAWRLTEVRAWMAETIEAQT